LVKQKTPPKRGFCNVFKKTQGVVAEGVGVWVGVVVFVGVLVGVDVFVGVIDGV